MNLSAIILAKNEERNIARCVQSLQGVIDDVLVIVDDSTTDATEAIVQGTGARYERRRWEGFAAAKQYALRQARYDWVLWIDADEALSPELRTELTTWKQQVPSFSAYTMPRRAYFLGKWIKHSGWYPGRVTRLFNKTNHSFSNSQVHETLLTNGACGELHGDIDHFTDPDIRHYYEKFNMYTTLAATDLAEKGKRFSLFNLLLNPLVLFIKMYVLRGGWMDGLHGLVLAVFSANYVFTKYAKLWETERDKRSSHAT